MQPIITYEEMISRFPNMKPKSMELAKRMLPIYSSPELAAVVAALMTDGHIDWDTSDGRPRTRKVILYSSKKGECEWFLKVCHELFGIEGKLAEYMPNHGFCKKQPYKAVISNAVLAMVFILSGVPAGNKTKTPYLLPGWITNGDSEIKAQFLRFFFNFEGSVPNKKVDRPCSWQMSLHVCKSPELLGNCVEFLEQIISILNEFDINCSCIGITNSVNKIGKNPIVHFSIDNQKSIVNFYKHIGFYSEEKTCALRECVYQIAKSGRILSEELSDKLVETKEKFGTDRKLVSEINTLTASRYTTRQVEHFRRMETKIPFDFAFAIIRLSESEFPETLPEYVKFLYELSVPSCH